MTVLTYLPAFRAYSVRRDGRVIGLVRFVFPPPFRVPVEFA